MRSTFTKKFQDINCVQFLHFRFFSLSLVIQVRRSASKTGTIPSFIDISINDKARYPKLKHKKMTVEQIS